MTSNDLTKKLLVRTKDETTSETMSTNPMSGRMDKYPLPQLRWKEIVHIQSNIHESILFSIFAETCWILLNRKLTLLSGRSLQLSANVSKRAQYAEHFDSHSFVIFRIWERENVEFQSFGTETAGKRSQKGSRQKAVLRRFSLTGQTLQPEQSSKVEY